MLQLSRAALRRAQVHAQVLPPLLSPHFTPIRCHQASCGLGFLKRRQTCNILWTKDLALITLGPHISVTKFADQAPWLYTSALAFVLWFCYVVVLETLIRRGLFNQNSGCLKLTPFLNVFFSVTVFQINSLGTWAPFIISREFSFAYLSSIHHKIQTKCTLRQ